MDDLTVVITGSGAPGIKGTLFSLVNNFDDRRIRTIGTDIRADVVGKHLCDGFYQISRPGHGEYLEQLLDICERESVDAILPQNTAELSVLAEHEADFSQIGSKIAISKKGSIETSNNKYQLLKIAEKIDVPIPEFSLVEKFQELSSFAEKLGWPHEPVVVKPPVSNGMRGFRIIDESIDLKKRFYEEKPTGVYTKMDDLRETLGPTFPPLLVMEHLPGEEYTVDVLSEEKMNIIPRKRDMIRSGITFIGTTEKDEEIIEYSRGLSEEIDLRYAYGFQFKRDGDGTPKLLEANPRIQGTMVLSTFAGANVIYGALKSVLDEPVPEFDIRWGTRIMRYWGGLGIHGREITGSL